MQCLGDHSLAKGGLWTERTDNRGAKHTSAGTHRSDVRRSRWTCWCCRAYWGRVEAIACTYLGPCIPAAGIGIKTVVNVCSGVTPASSTGVVSTAASINGSILVICNGIAPGADILIVQWVNFVHEECRSRPITGLERIDPTNELWEGGFCEMAVRTTVQSIDLLLEGLY